MISSKSTKAVQGNERRGSIGTENNGSAIGTSAMENQQPNHKPYSRHTPEQKRELEAFFAKWPHPNKQQRVKISHDLGLDPFHIKYWFQNKLTQLKTQHEHDENIHLHEENDKLKAENEKYKKAVENPCCDVCRVKLGMTKVSLAAHNLIVENERLKKELEQLAGIMATYVGKPVSNVATTFTPHSTPNSLESGLVPH